MDTSVNTDNDDWDDDGNGAETDDDKDASGRHAEYTYGAAGAYNIRLIVYDNDWQVATDTTTATIAAASPSDSGPSPLPSPEEEEIEIIDNFDPGSLPMEAQLPVFDYVAATLGYDEMMNISDYYAGDSAHIDNLGNWNMVSGNHTIITNAYTGSVMHIDRIETYRPAYPWPLPPLDYRGIADAFIASIDGIDDAYAAAVFEGFTDCSIATNEEGGRSADSRIPFQRCADYRRHFTVTPTMNTYPAVGPGGKLRVVVNGGGDARGFTKVWRQVEQRIPDILLVGAAQAVQDFHDLVGKALYGTRIVPDCKRIEIDSVSIGYYEDDFLTYQETIYPVYVLHLTCEDDTSSHKTQVYVPAQWAPLQANIDAPSDGAVYNHGDPITFNGSAAGGAPPYTYSWESEVDGPLGSGSSIVVSDLTVNHRSSEPTQHVIALAVTDNEDQTAISYISVLINPGTIPDAKLLAADDPVALLGPVVTLSFSDLFYVEDQDRTSGIWVDSDAMPAEDSTVVVHGVMDTVYEERCIVASDVEVIGQTEAIEPLCTNMNSIGGGDFGTPPLGQKGITGASGLNNVGLLMRTSGEVSWVSGGSPYFIISDGTYRVHCTPPGGTQQPQLGDFCTVTGVSCIGYVAADNLQRCLIPRGDSDIQVLPVP